MRHRRKRSAAITLVLAGTITGCGEPVAPQRDVYDSLAACRTDWGDAQQCEPVKDTRYAPSYFYGPAYYGRAWPNGNPRGSSNAMDAIRVSGPVARPGATRTASSTSFSTHTRSSTSRGGFGSSSRSSSS